jgi:hypothetical protein
MNTSSAQSSTGAAASRATSGAAAAAAAATIAAAEAAKAAAAAAAAASKAAALARIAAAAEAAAAEDDACAEAALDSDFDFEVAEDYDEDHVEDHAVAGAEVGAEVETASSNGGGDEEVQPFNTDFSGLVMTAYDSRDALLSAVQERAISEGFSTSIDRSNKGMNVYIKCVFGGEYRDRVNAPGS